MPEGNNEGGLRHGLSVVLPELPYNFIGRILPGVTLLAIGAFSFNVLEPAAAIGGVSRLSWAPALVLAVLYSAAGYVCALFLSLPQNGLRQLYIPTVWRPILSRYRRLIIARQHELYLDGMEGKLGEIIPGDSGRAAASNTIVRDVASSVYDPLHDFLKARNPQARLVLPQMNAEAGFFDQLCVGLVVLSFANLGFVFGRLTTTYWPSALFLPLALWCGLAARYRYDALVKRHFAYWSTLPSADGKS